jgi:RNA polymerase sigma-70 factor (ECF subfamily)
VDITEFDGEITMKDTRSFSDPEQSATGAQLREFLEQAVLDLPEQYRAVVMLRDIEEPST